MAGGRLSYTMKGKPPSRAFATDAVSLDVPSSYGKKGYVKYGHLVVVHNGVHGFDPHGVDVPVEYNPLVRLVLVEALESTEAEIKTRSRWK